MQWCSSQQTLREQRGSLCDLTVGELRLAPWEVGLIPAFCSIHRDPGLGTYTRALFFSDKNSWAQHPRSSLHCSCIHCQSVPMPR